MKHQFALILSGAASITPRLANALYQATNGDIEFEMRDGAAFLEFTRTGPTLREAILSAIDEVQQAKAGVRVVRVESEAANTIATINAELYEAMTKE
jgi:ATP phosphoribosyltransferase